MPRESKIRLGKAIHFLDVHRRNTVPERAAKCLTEAMKYINQESIYPCLDELAKLLKRTRPAIEQMEKALLKRNILTGSRRKGTLKIYKCFAKMGKRDAQLLLIVDYLSDRGSYLKGTNSTGLNRFKAKIKKLTGISYDTKELRERIQKLIENKYLSIIKERVKINRELWQRDKLIIKELYENGLDSYQIPDSLIFGE
ncbi:MAG: hypothetical protein AB1393_10830 [Candidatus Edwardsbacteria bacterium]